MSLALLFHYLMLNMFRMLIHPSSGACDLFVELFHGLYCSVRREAFALAYLFSGECLVVTCVVVWESVVLQISRKLLRMDVLTLKTCWALTNEIIKQVTSSWSLFVQLVEMYFGFSSGEDTLHSCEATWELCAVCKDGSTSHFYESWERSTKNSSHYRHSLAN